MFCKKVLLVLSLCFLSSLVVGSVTAKDAEVIEGCLVLELTNPKALPDKTTGETQYPELNHILNRIKVVSLNHEFGQYLRQYRVLRFSPLFQTEELVAELENLMFIKRVWKNKALSTSQLTRVPNDPQYFSQWHHSAINSASAWGVSTGKKEVVIGIIDSGIQYTHPDLIESMWINPEEDLNGNGIFDESDIDSLDNDNNGYVDDVIGWDWVNVSEGEVFPGEDYNEPDNNPMDFQGHGTHCAGDAAATTNNINGVAGPGWGCSVAALRAGWKTPNGHGSVGLVEATSAVTYAIQQEFDVLSMSFGGGGGNPGFFTDALELARENGIVSVAAAGNQASDSYHYPAALPSVIAVASSNENNNLSWFSNFGDWVAITAPGSNILSTSINNRYGPASGTSMACPILAGIIGQMKSIAPNWDPWRFDLRLALTADEMQDEGSGAGLVNFGRFIRAFVCIDSVWVKTDAMPRLYYDTEGTISLKWYKQDFFDFGVSLTLEADSDNFELGEDSLWVGDITEGDNGLWEVPITVYENEETEGEISLGVRLKGNDRFGQPFEYVQYVFFEVEQSLSLIINNDLDDTGNIENYYEATLAQLGISSDKVHRSNLSSLEGLLDNYQLVVLATGERTENTLPGEDVAFYEDYLAENGKLIITGQNIAEDLATSNPSTLSDFLSCSFVEGHSNSYEVYGEDFSLTEDLYFVLNGDGGADNQNSLDVILPTANSTPLFVYSEGDEDGCAAIEVNHNNGKLAFFSFGLESINDEIAFATTRFEWFERLLSYWGMQTGVHDFEKEVDLPKKQLNVWPNPSNGRAIVSFNLVSAAEVEIRLFNVTGQEIFSEVFMSQPGIANYALTYPQQLSSGTYFLNVKTVGLNQTKKVFLLK